MFVETYASRQVFKKVFYLQEGGKLRSLFRCRLSLSSEIAFKQTKCRSDASESWMLLTPQGISSAVCHSWAVAVLVLGSQLHRRGYHREHQYLPVLFPVWQTAWWHPVHLMLQHHTPGLAALQITTIHQQYDIYSVIRFWLDKEGCGIKCFTRMMQSGSHRTNCEMHASIQEIGEANYAILQILFLESV